MDFAMVNPFAGSFISMKHEIPKRALSILQKMKTIFAKTILSTSTHPPPPTPPGDIEWLIKLLALCFGALGVATQSLQYLQEANQCTKLSLPPMYYLFCSTHMAALVVLILSRYLPSSDGSNLRRILEQLGIFLEVVSFFAAITLIFPLWMKFTSGGIFIVTILIIIGSYLFRVHTTSQSHLHSSSPPSELDVQMC